MSDFDTFILMFILTSAPVICQWILGSSYRFELKGPKWGRISKFFQTYFFWFWQNFFLYIHFCKWSFRWVQHYRSKQLQFLTFPCRHTAVVSCCFGIPPQLNMNQFYCLCREWRRPDCTFRNWCCMQTFELGKQQQWW